jgi:hypothetical protein
LKEEDEPGEDAWYAGQEVFTEVSDDGLLFRGSDVDALLEEEDEASDGFQTRVGGAQGGGVRGIDRGEGGDESDLEVGGVYFEDLGCESRGVVSPDDVVGCG